MEQKQLLNKEIFPIRLKEIMLENNQTIYTLSERINLSAATVSPIL
ncbi:helix-turn-helix domain-containing protein [Bacillus thuringiensis]